VPTITDDEAALVIRALEHFHAFLVATKREDGQYKELADRLQRKLPDAETTTTQKKKKLG